MGSGLTWSDLCRLQWIGEARVAIDNAGKEPEAITVTTSPARSGKLPWVIAAGAVLIVASAASWIVYRATRPV